MVLAALDQGGVDNWEWYSESIRDFAEDLNKEAHLIAKLPLCEVFDTFVEKEIKNYIGIQMDIKKMRYCCNYNGIV